MASLLYPIRQTESEPISRDDVVEGERARRSLPARDQQPDFRFAHWRRLSALGFVNVQPWLNKFYSVEITLLVLVLVVL